MTKFKEGDKVMYEGKEWEVSSYHCSYYLLHLYGTNNGEGFELDGGAHRKDFLSKRASEKDITKIGEELKEGDLVYVSNKSEEDVIECKFEYIFLMKSIKGKYICVSAYDKYEYNRGKGFDTICWKYAAKIPTDLKQERKIEATDKEWEKIQEILGISE